MFRRLDRRERLVLAAGATVGVLALSVVAIVVPLTRRWSEREATISHRAEQLTRLRALPSRADLERGDVPMLERERLALERRLLPGPTAAVANSNLQLLLNRYAAESGLTLQSVDAAGRAGGEGPLRHIPARITARGDIRGLVDLLLRLERGETLLAVDELRVRTSPGAREGPDALGVSVGLHGFYRSGGSGR